MGPHYTRTMTFAAWVAHVDVVAQALKEAMAKVPRLMLVWRSSFMTEVRGCLRHKWPGHRVLVGVGRHGPSQCA